MRVKILGNRRLDRATIEKLEAVVTARMNWADGLISPFRDMRKNQIKNSCRRNSRVTGRPPNWFAFEGARPDARGVISLRRFGIEPRVQGHLAEEVLLVIS